MRNDLHYRIAMFASMRHQGQRDKRMFFDTPVYIVFLAFVVVTYWRLPHRGQNIFLLIASYFFYGWWDWRFLTLIAISTYVDFQCARHIARLRNVGARRMLLFVSLAVNVSFLGFFKYFNFFEESLVAVLNSLGADGVTRQVLLIVLPPGISFYTFQEIAYIVDVYNRRLKPADSLVEYALFISLFPHLIAGPIQRPSHLLPQVQNARVLDWDRFFSGLMLILCGLFRKCVVADNCALLADAAFSGNLGPQNLAVLLIGCYAFAWQIYGDFSGYSDIARGSAQLLGFHFMVNFRQPYLATSLQDFWRRWHISLSTWLRDYLYIPLGGSRHGTMKTYRNLIVTMLLGGLWHGANWTFVIWGGIHGLGLALERMTRGFLGLREPETVDLRGQQASLCRLTSWISRILIFHLVCLAWVFFRASSINAAVELLAGATTFYWRPEFFTAFEFLTFYSGALFLVDVLNEYRAEEYLFENSSQSLRLGVAFVLLILLTCFSGNKINAFIYFQF